MLELAAGPLRHVVFAGGGYLVPRSSGTTLAGSTMEKVGFDSAITGDARAHLLGVAAAASASLSAAPVLRHWAGLRPLTPDLQPIVGRDPDQPTVVYACGHSRNGILMAPLTGEVVAALLSGDAPGYDLSAFSPTRFASM
jgi:glycine oxidase